MRMKNGKVNPLQGVSLTVVPPDPKKDDRRHKVWCKFYDNGICFSPNNWAYNNNHCPSSKHCIYYQEDITKKPPEKTEIIVDIKPQPLKKEKIIPKYAVYDFEVGDIIVCIEDGWYGEIIDIKQNKNNTLAVVNCDNGERKTISLNAYVRENRLEFV